MTAATLPRVAAATRPVVVGSGRRAVALGDGSLALMIGPCAVESTEQLALAARAVAAAGARFLRGGAYKPRTSPYSFQGLGLPGLRLLAAAARAHELLVVSEVLDPDDAAAAAEYVDLLQIGARTMACVLLLRAVARTGRPVLLKRGFGATVDELLHAAEHLLDAGAPGVVLCERGIRTFETCTRFTADLGAVAWLRAHTRLPVVVDPSHAAGARALVPPLARAAVAAGADGLLVEVHPSPADALCDADQALRLEDLPVFVAGVRAVHQAVAPALSAPALQLGGQNPQ
jgi:3-deoxy-7-phosphoheptulonate synthase